MKINDIILKENDDMFAQSNRVGADIEEYNHPLKHLGIDQIDYATFINELEYLSNFTTTDSRLAAAMDVVEGYLDAPLCKLIDNVLSGALRMDRERFSSDLVRAFEDGQQRYGTEPRAALDGFINLATQARRAAQNADDDEELDEAEVELDEPPAPERKTQTKDKPRFDYDPFQQKPDQPLAQRQDEPKGKQSNEPKGFRKASAAGTRRAAGSVHATDQMRDMLGRMRDIEIDPDLAPYPTEEPNTEVSVDVNTENLPAVAGEAIQAAGMSSPEFHQVARLPGNMSAMIRQLGKKLFGSMTSTPTEDIYMIGNLGGQGPNTRQEVNAVANFVQQHGEDMGPGDIDFNAIMPGYTAETHQFVAAGIRWLMVKDFAGQYIYAWPESDSKTPSSQAQLGNAPKRLR